MIPALKINEKHHITTCLLYTSLNKEVFGDVITLEPIHKLIEQATFEDMNQRISIHQCIDYLELQRNLLDERELELLSNELVLSLIHILVE